MHSDVFRSTFAKRPGMLKRREFSLAKVGVEGSNPFARSKQIPEKSAQLRNFRAPHAASISLNKPRTVPNCLSALGTAWAKEFAQGSTQP
jgi:hypothetical protein